ncbi:hypothetical protein ABT052_44115 [Streptomyces sp. NPDC002766]|uniref:hypothetical protein n=1 Tax=unclassified Streptomyces TaxID=2593676 RepID=UPI0033263C33
MRLPVPDTRHADPAMVDRLDSYFTTKSEKHLDDYMGHFTEDAFYADAVLGWTSTDRAAIREAVAKFMPNWGTGTSYATRIVGNDTGAIIAVTDTPELFGSEIRALSVVDYVDGSVARFVDYWDSRHFGREAASHMRTPADAFPTHLGEDAVSSTTDQTITGVVKSLVDALTTGDVAATLDLFADDIVFEDNTLRLQISGKYATGSFLTRSNGQLPYAQNVTPVHIVGGAQGGGFEWRAPAADVKFGVVCVELDDNAKISRLTTVWDGGLVDDQQFTKMMLWSTDVAV